ncbi:MAG: hypothetical protein WAJ95_08290, partial [Desulfobacterales bacterium]
MFTPTDRVFLIIFFGVDRLTAHKPAGFFIAFPRILQSNGGSARFAIDWAVIGTQVCAHTASGFDIWS